METKTTKNSSEKNGTFHCGSSPKKIAIGIAPLGFISIGIVPMGVFTIGVVPMGVVSLGIVAMGVVNASIVGMGVFSAGLTTMGIWEWSPNGRTHNHHGQAFDSSSNNLAYSTRLEAEEAAKEIGCKGVHKMGPLWMPCETHESK